ncbi:RNA polymerase sigma factor RpoD/SigA [Pedobacter heparinus]|uniref:sigma-70 family RNA polymerase sigma factor n=1 Tax=Pedobacter heparinus TaxID=984 RepID=UPI00292F6206|nr:RNA polymerase sigma factor RpoD/SigA [Pedobacter heparinus]
MMKQIKIEKSITHRNQESLLRYLQEISKYPLLTAAEEIALAKKIKAGDLPALKRLVNCNLRFVVTVAKKYETSGLLLADLVSDGNIGLITAAERFDEKRGFKFISYAVWWIRQSILQGINMHKRMIHLPMNQIQGLREIGKSEMILEQELQRMPTRQELAVFMNIPEDVLYDSLFICSTPFSLDTPVEDKEGEMISGMVQYARGTAPDASLESASLQKDIRRMMTVLTPRERNILLLAYGMNNSRPLQNDDISNVLGLSKETIRRSKSKALNRLRGLKEIKMMRHYL